MLYRDPPTAQGAVISIAPAMEAGSIRLPRHEKERKSHKSVDGNRDPQATRGVAISIAGAMEAGSIRLPHNAKKKNRAKSVDGNRDPQATRGVAISIADAMEAGSIRLPRQRKKEEPRFLRGSSFLAKNRSFYRNRLRGCIHTQRGCSPRFKRGRVLTTVTQKKNAFSRFSCSCNKQLTTLLFLYISSA